MWGFESTGERSIKEQNEAWGKGIPVSARLSNVDHVKSTMTEAYVRQYNHNEEE